MWGLGGGWQNNGGGGGGTITGGGITPRIAMFTGATSIGDGTWEFSGNTIRPVTDGSDIGDITHRVATLYMASSNSASYLICL